jgi:hypothetical protein
VNMNWSENCLSSLIYLSDYLLYIYTLYHTRYQSITPYSADIFSNTPRIVLPLFLRQ